MKNSRKSSKIVVNFIKRDNSNRFKTNDNSDSKINKLTKASKKIINDNIEEEINNIEETDDLGIKALGETYEAKRGLKKKIKYVNQLKGKIKDRKIKRKAKKQAKKHGIGIAKKQFLKSIKKPKLIAQFSKVIVKSLGKVGLKIVAHPYTWIAVGVIVGGLLIVNLIASMSTLLVSSTSSIFAEEKVVIGYKQVMEEINKEYIDKIQGYKEKYDEVIISVEGENGVSNCGWKDVLIVMTVKYEQDLPEAKKVKDELRQLFSKFNKMETREEEIVEEQEDGTTITKKKLIIILNNPDLDSVLKELKFTDAQKDWVKSLREADFKEMFPDIDFSDTFLGPSVGGDIPTLTPEELKKLLENMPTTSVSRKNLITTGVSIKGKVQYFWGGKSSVTGWNSAWGRPTLVTSPGSYTTGTYRPYGLDCSGFVDWVYRTAGVGNMFSGGGTYYQYANSYSIAASQLEPGDLVFNADLSHVGLFFGYDSSGQKLFIHCTPNGGVVVDNYKGFTLYRKPFVKF